MNVLGLEVDCEPHNRGRFRFYPIGDLHLDAITTDRDRVNRYIAKIAEDPHAVYVVVGDLVDGTTPSHRFFETQVLRPEVVQNMGQYIDAMIQELVNVLSPLQGKPGVFIQGNHDIRRGGTQYSGIVQAVARGVGGLYGGDEALIRLRAARDHGPKSGKRAYTWVIHAHHGAGGGMYPGGKVNRFQNTVGQLVNADIYVRGHVHDSDARIVPVYSVNRKQAIRLIKKPRAFVTAPSFAPARTEGVNNYASRKGYPPNDEGIMFLHCTNPCPGKDKPPKIRREEWAG